MIKWLTFNKYEQMAVDFWCSYRTERNTKECTKCNSSRWSFVVTSHTHTRIKSAEIKLDNKNTYVNTTLQFQCGSYIFLLVVVVII